MRIKEKISKFILKYILKRRYVRLGKCARCGACCTNIYIRHKGSVISDIEEFKEILKKDPCAFYRQITPISKDDLGLIFKCTKFDSAKRLCKCHFLRPLICRKYPGEEIFDFGAILSPECGFRFEPIESFKSVLNKIEKSTKGTVKFQGFGS